MCIRDRDRTMCAKLEDCVIFGPLPKIRGVAKKRHAFNNAFPGVNKLQRLFVMKFDPTLAANNCGLNYLTSSLDRSYQFNILSNTRFSFPKGL